MKPATETKWQFTYRVAMEAGLYKEADEANRTICNQPESEILRIADWLGAHIRGELRRQNAYVAWRDGGPIIVYRGINVP